MQVYNPKYWKIGLDHPERIYKAWEMTPTIGEVYTHFGDALPSEWIRVQVTCIYVASPNSEKGMIEGIRMFSESFASQVKEWKLTELMLFFARYQAGYYDTGWASFNPRSIGNAFFNQFVPQWRKELGRMFEKEVQERVMQNTQKPSDIPEGYTSLTWYQELKRRESQGDSEAHLLLHPEERNFSA
jgi:hypothetical protein